MDARPDSMNRPALPPSDEVLKKKLEIEATRERLVHTVKQIEEKLNPDVLAHKAKDKIKEQANTAMHQLRHDVADKIRNTVDSGLCTAQDYYRLARRALRESRYAWALPLAAAASGVFIAARRHAQRAPRSLTPARPVSQVARGIAQHPITYGMFALGFGVATSLMMGIRSVYREDREIEEMVAPSEELELQEDAATNEGMALNAADYLYDEVDDKFQPPITIPPPPPKMTDQLSGTMP